MRNVSVYRWLACATINVYFWQQLINVAIFGIIQTIDAIFGINFNQFVGVTKRGATNNGNPYRRGRADREWERVVDYSA